MCCNVWCVLYAGVDKAHSLKETVVQHPYLFGSQSSSLVPPATNGGGGGGGGGGGLTRVKAASMECLVTLNEPALAHSLSVGSKVEGTYSCIYMCAMGI